MDAPETRQTCARGEREVRCGRAATAALRRLIDNEPVSCQERDVDRYRRIVAVCFNAEGQDVGAELVREGWALAYRRFSLDYVDEEREAKASKAGLWSMDFVAPWDWRRGVRLAAEPINPPANDNTAGQCQIKGNISSRGEHIYHVPGGAYYSRTKINPAKGERFFCSEAEAEAAGHRDGEGRQDRLGSQVEIAIWAAQGP